MRDRALLWFAGILFASFAVAAEEAPRPDLAFQLTLGPLNTQGFESVGFSEMVPLLIENHIGAAAHAHFGSLDQPFCFLSKWRNAGTAPNRPFGVYQGFSIILSPVPKPDVPSFYRSIGRFIDSAANRTYAWRYFTVGLDQKSYPFQELTCRSEVRVINAIEFDTPTEYEQLVHDRRLSPYQPIAQEWEWLHESAGLQIRRMEPRP